MQADIGEIRRDGLAIRIAPCRIGNTEAEAELPQTSERLLVHPALMPWLYGAAYTLGKTGARPDDLVQGGAEFLQHGSVEGEGWGKLKKNGSQLVA